MEDVLRIRNFFNGMCVAVLRIKKKNQKILTAAVRFDRCLIILCPVLELGDSEKWAGLDFEETTGEGNRGE